MHQAMQLFDENNGCRIIGLSGMLIGVSNDIKKDTVSHDLRLLEATFRSKIITVNNLDDHKNALLHSTKAAEYPVRYIMTSMNDCVSTISNRLQKFIELLTPIKLNNVRTLSPKTLRETIPGSIMEIIKLFKDVQYQGKNMGAYGVYLDLLSVLIQLELSKRYGPTEKFRNIVKPCITEVERCIHRMKTELNIHEKNTYTIKHSSLKIQKLIECLKELFTDPRRSKDLQCLVFTERRSTAKALYHLVKYYADYSKETGEIFPVVPDFVVGQNNELPNDIECIISQSFNMKALKKFANKETNVIFCTDVLEEGIDLQLCNAVIMYDKPKTFRSYMQSRGRARDDESKYFIMIDNESETKFNKKMADWQEIDKTMKTELIGNTLDRESPSDELIAEQNQQPWDPFLTKTGSQLNALNAITLLNQYAQNLISSRFYSGSPIDWRRIDLGPRSIMVAIRLPPVIMNEIISDEFSDIKLAKQHAAFKVCIELYKAGELTENLTPFNPEQKIELVQEDYFAHWKKYENDNPKKAGTKKNLRFHQMKVPNTLIQSSPQVNGYNFLYRITTRPEFDTKDVLYLKVFYDLLRSKSSYGILTSKRIPKLCRMPLFPSFGEVECEIQTPPAQVQIKNYDELRKLRKFQVTVFRDILDSWWHFFVIDKDAFIIVPLDEDYQVDWKIVEQFQTLSTTPLISEPQKFYPHDYSYKVITPTYRDAGNYIVVKIREDLSPLSPFPENFPTYKDYYIQKYSLEARNDQFMMECKAVSKNWNFFFPGAGSTGENLRSFEKRGNSEILIPQFCHNYKFPGHYWLKALLLPSVLHRMHYLLLAEELRIRLIEEGIDEDRVPQVYKLDVDYGDYKSKDNDSNDFNEDNDKERLSKEKFEKALIATKTQTKQHVVRSKAQLLFDPIKLPKDLDRDWANVSGADIDNYVKFMTDNAGTVVPSNLPHLCYPISGRRAILDSKFRKDIELLKRNPKNFSVQQKDLLKVLTTSNAGDVIDMERFETLGDAFLKFIASLFIFKTHEKWSEGHMTTLKGRLVSNRNLFYIGNEYGLSTMLKTKKFCDNNKYYGLAPSTMLPRNILMLLKANKNLLSELLNFNENLSDLEVEQGFLNTDNILKFSTDKPGDFDSHLAANLLEQEIGDKIIADAVEALIGCVVSSLGVYSALKLCGTLKILSNDDGNLNKLLTEEIPPRVTTPEANQTIINNRNFLEQTIGYKFTNQIYLLQALTHSSNPIKPAGTYEQLEFLGDAVLDFLITSYISQQCPKMDPGMLTDLRSALVNNVTLACIVVRNNLHKFLRFENHALMETIKKFVDFQDSVQHKVTDQIIILETEDDTSASGKNYFFFFKNNS